MTQLAPIGISTYNRLNHLKRTIDALKKNTISDESILYIFSDAAKPGDEDSVKKLRDYIHTINGFKHIHIRERTTNSRVANGRGGILEMLNEYGKAIFLEDDIVTQPGFLRFMNDGLEFYKNNNLVLSITGYSPPISLPPDYTQDVYALNRFNAWGAGLWLDKFNMVRDISHDDLQNINKQKLQIYGEDIYAMLELEAAGKIDAYDVKAMFLQYITGMRTIYPRKSLVQNIGHDGSGVHCGVTNRFHHNYLWEKEDDFVFMQDTNPDPQIIDANYKFRKLSLKQNIASLLEKLGIYHSVYKLLKRQQ